MSYNINNNDLTTLCITGTASHPAFANYLLKGSDYGNSFRVWATSDGSYFKLGNTNYTIGNVDIGNQLVGIYYNYIGTDGGNGHITSNAVSGSIASNGTQTSYSLTIPVGVKNIKGFCISSGGGGGGTRNGSIEYGGGGGGGGACAVFSFPYISGTNTINIMVANGGVGGQSSNTNSWGESGGNGAVSYVSYGNSTATANGGGGGGGGGANAGAIGGGGGATGGLINNYKGNDSAGGNTNSLNAGGFDSINSNSEVGNIYPAITSLNFTNYGAGGSGGAANNVSNGTNSIGYGGKGGYVRIYFLQ